MTIYILTIFPEFFETPLQSSILKRAQTKQMVEFEVINLRQFATDKHHLTDDRPYGGGPGMVMMVEPIDRALQSIAEPGHVVLTSAKGRPFTQGKAVEYAQLTNLTLICGHYEGVDERVAEHLVDEEVRIGDYVLTGGEAAALVMTDAVTRLLPGVLGNEASLEDESHQLPDQLGYPQYTRPADYRGWSVPSVLLSGDHAQIDRWRRRYLQASPKKNKRLRFTSQVEDV